MLKFYSHGFYGWEYLYVFINPRPDFCNDCGINLILKEILFNHILIFLCWLLAQHELNTEMLFILFIWTKSNDFRLILSINSLLLFLIRSHPLSRIGSSSNQCLSLSKQHRAKRTSAASQPHAFNISMLINGN